MSLNRYIKVPSVQSGKFNLTNLNRIDFDLDPDQVYDMKNSWIELNMNVVASESTSGKTGVYKVKSVMPNHPETKLENVMLVKNCHLRSSKNGMLEDIRDVNVLRSNLSDLMDSSTDQRGKAYKEVGHLFENNGLKSSLFRELHKEGNVSSRDVQAPVRIKMDELFNLGSLKEFDCRKLGRCRAHIELDNVLTFEPQTEAEMGGAVSFDDVTGANNNIVTLTTKDSYDVLEDSPFWVGQVVKINALGTGGVGNVVNKYVKITEILYEANRTVRITFDDKLPDLTGGQTYTLVTVDPVAADTVSFTIDFSELVTQVVGNPSQMADKLTYTTYSTEQYNANGLTNFQRLFQVEPEAVSLMVMFPTDNNGVVSSNDDVSDYRLKIDNIDQTDRNVKPHSPLYYNILNDVMLDANLAVANLNEFSLDARAQGEDKRTTGVRLLFVPAKLEQTQREKNIQVSINATGGGVKLVNLYKLVVREI